MKLYADTSSRFARQLVADVLVVLWVVTWAWIGNVVHDGTLELAGPGLQLEESAGSLSVSMTEAGDVLGGVPVVGDEVATPFDRASSASESLAAAGRAEVEAVEGLALWLGLSVALIPILVVLAFYVPGRVRFARQAGAGQRFVDADPDVSLFALRAMAHQPMHVLGRISDDPVGAWQRGDQDVVRALAQLELATLGLKAPSS